MKKRFIFFFVLVNLFSVVFSQEIFKKKLENGFEIYVLENNSAPLTYIEIAVRTGASSQTPENAGLFHLYEHILFKGNSEYKNQKEFTDALNKMGVDSWNGSTSTDIVNYYFTVPSNNTEKGIAFWAAALKSPLIDEKELENEKDVVISEISGNFSNPSRINYAAICKNLFPESTFRLDTSGTVENVRNATRQQLLEIKEQFYIPSNSAIFVGGDVKHEEIFAYGEKYFSDWKTASVPKLSVMSKEPLRETKKIIYPNRNIRPGQISAALILRGPDGEVDAGDTYASDVLSNFLAAPDCAFKKIFLSNKILALPDADYVSYSYFTQRFTGLQNFYCTMPDVSGKGENVFEKCEEFLRVIEDEAVPLLENPASYDKKSLAKSIKIMNRSREYSLEIPADYISNLVFFWASVDSQYFFDYEKNLKNVTKNDIVSFVKKYISGKKGLFSVQVNPSTFEANKEKFLEAGYEVIDENNAFWWKQ